MKLLNRFVVITPPAIPIKKAWLCDGCECFVMPEMTTGEIRCPVCGSLAVEPVTRWIRPVRESWRVWVRPGPVDEKNRFPLER